MARKKLTARQRGYSPKKEVAASLRALANQIQAEDDGRTLMKVTFNAWYTPDDEMNQQSTSGSLTNTNRPEVRGDECDDD